ncbi:hypothetical protein niasHS_006693 [Heterodera schachtii]|uniref:28S ribosomal protein S18a, mitochondrial n=1 Tax=Heterodera schachtii TaxID=97005 RepID=A0ABD2JHZ3_HETSC
MGPVKMGLLFMARINYFRAFSSTVPRFFKQVKHTVQDNVTTIELVDVPIASTHRELKESAATQSKTPDDCSCVLCKIPTSISYKDVLILEQFMRLDGTVFPRQLTGLCHDQQQRLERCVMQAHWSGLFPDRTIPEFDRAGYKRFNRHWDDDLAMFRLKYKLHPGSWFYIKRYNPRIREYRPFKADEIPDIERE